LISPEPQGEEESDFGAELEDFVFDVGDYPDWKEVLDSFGCGSEVEIDRVEYEHVEARRPTEPEFVELIEAPKGFAGKFVEKELSQEELAELLTHTIRDLAAYLLAEEGIGSQELGYFYGVLIEHVRAKLLDGASPATATPELLKRALHHRSTLQRNIKDRLGLVTSVIKYRQEVKSASQ
jgi:hypothetical protein